MRSSLYGIVSTGELTRFRLVHEANQLLGMCETSSSVQRSRIVQLTHHWKVSLIKSCIISLNDTTMMSIEVLV